MPAVINNFGRGVDITNQDKLTGAQGAQNGATFNPKELRGSTARSQKFQAHGGAKRSENYSISILGLGEALSIHYAKLTGAREEPHKSSKTKL